VTAARVAIPPGVAPRPPAGVRHQLTLACPCLPVLLRHSDPDGRVVGWVVLHRSGPGAGYARGPA
jgi:hypothetical protein